MSAALPAAARPAERPLPLYALLVAISAGSALLGFAREATIAAFLGASRGADALYAALALPFAAAWFLVGGALAPALTARMAALFAAGRSDAAAAAETARLLALLGAYGLLTALGLLVAAGLNAASAYRTPAVAVLLGNGAALALLFAPGARGPLPAALAFVGGAAVTLLVELPAAHGAGLLARPRGAAAVRLPLSESGILLVALAALAGIDVLERPFASHAGAGAVAILAYASKLLHLPMRLFAAPLAAVALPRLARRAADPVASPREAERAAGLTLRLLLLAAAVAAGAALPIATVAFGRGRFDAAALARLAGALRLLAPAIVFVGFFEMAGKLLVAERRAGRVAAAHGAGLAAYAVAAPFLARLGVPGLAGARDVAWGVSALLLARAFAGSDVRPLAGLLPALAGALLAAPAAALAAARFDRPLLQLAAAGIAASAVFALAHLPARAR